MTQLLTQAKPYAKAIFDLALHDNQLASWQQTLTLLAQMALACKEKQLLDQPQISIKQKIDFFAEAVKQSSGAMNLVKLLAKRKRLAILPEIAATYQQLSYAHHKTLEVKLVSSSELTKTQKEQLLSALEKRYQCEILLQYHVDDKLIGGAVIYAADKVIDGSISGMLQNLKQNLLLKNTYAKTK